MQPFAQKLHLNGNGLRRRAVDVLQVNMGRYCNLACIHCHVESGPTRREMMSRQNVEAVLGFFARSGIPTMDITGGAPELHPDFDHLVAAARELGRHVMDRCNLTVIFEPGKQYLPEFFKRHEVELVCSLPCYSKENVDKQRGKGTFDASIRALQRLNEIGYGQVDSELVLNLVYNPWGRTCRRRKRSWNRIISEFFASSSASYSIIFFASPTCRSPVMPLILSCAASTIVTYNCSKTTSTPQPWTKSCAIILSVSAGTALCMTATSIRCSIFR
jgi:radical SAM/Cys-rich protein